MIGGAELTHNSRHSSGQHRTKRKQEWGKRKIAFIGIALLVFLVVVLLITFRFDQSRNGDGGGYGDQQIYGDESLGIDAGVDEQLRDYRTIGLLGIDSGKRSDIIMAITINKRTKKAKIVTVHRDTYMQISPDPDDPYIIDGIEREFYKCNRAYKKGGKYGAMTELNRHMDLNMREIICIDWDCTARLVDRLGGIEVDMDEILWQAVNDALPADNQIEHPGRVTLNGWQAVEYFRARKYPGGSAPIREARAQEFVKWLFENAKTMELDELVDIYNDVSSGLETNMSRMTLTKTLAELSKMELEETDEWPYIYEEMWESDYSYYYFVPDTLESNVKDFHGVMFDQNNYEPSQTVKDLNNRIEELREGLH